MDVNALRQSLGAIGQSGVFRFYDKLDEKGKEQLTRQLSALDAPALAKLVDEYVKQKPHMTLPANLAPVKVFPRTPEPNQKALYNQAREQGDSLLRAGKVAAFLVAGGQGTRLGFDGPKGEYPITPIRAKPLFQVFAEQLLAQERIFERRVPWYIMTSDVNDDATRAFFKQHDYFGYESEDVIFFQQGMIPAFNDGGDMLLAALDSLALSPDGHGGSLRALRKSGALADMRRRGVEHLSYFQVDNPLVHCIDPLFIGLHAIAGSEMSSKTIPKAGPLEKVGNFVFGDGSVQVIEYSDLPEELARQTNPDGSLRFNAGSIAIHVLDVSFIERLTADGNLRLPWHRAEKKVPYVDATGALVKPDKPNAVKLEQFVFDAIPLAKNAMVYETDRAEEFSPVKNAEGVDSAVSCRRDQVRRAARWLSAAGVKIPLRDGEPAAKIEISPLYAENEEELHDLSPSVTIVPNSEVYLGAQGIELI